MNTERNSVTFDERFLKEKIKTAHPLRIGVKIAKKRENIPG